MAVNRPRWVPGIGQQKPLPEKATENCPPRVYLSHSSVRLLSQAFNGRGRPTDQRLVYGKSTRMLGSFLPFHSPESGKWKKNFSLYTVLNFHSPRRVELNTSCWTFHSISTLSSRVLYRLCLVCLEFCLRHTGWMSVEHCWNYTKSFSSSFHLWCSVMEDSADIELYEEIVSNPAYSSSSDTNKSDPVWFAIQRTQTNWM